MSFIATLGEKNFAASRHYVFYAIWLYFKICILPILYTRKIRGSKKIFGGHCTLQVGKYKKIVTHGKRIYSCQIYPLHEHG